MSNPTEAALAVQNATMTVITLAKLCKRHPELRATLREASTTLRKAMLELHRAILPETPRPQPPAAPLGPVEPHLGPEQGSLAKALLLEVILRAASDWVLYRTHKRMAYQEWAKDAYIWLFEEGPDHLHWKERKSNGKLLTSFVSICEVLDFDPDLVRRHIRALTPQRIISMGRPAEYRRKRLPTAEYADVSDVRSFFAAEGGLM